MLLMLIFPKLYSFGEGPGVLLMSLLSIKYSCPSFKTHDQTLIE